MRLVLLTSDGPEHRHVARVLADAFPSELSAIVLARPRPRSLRARIRSYLRRYTVTQLASRVAARAYSALRRRDARRDATIERVLYPRGDDGRLPRPDLVHVVSGHNAEDALSLLRHVGPDVIAVYGTQMIKEPVIRMARTGILNMHTGVSPRYRGSDTIFWALHNEEPENVGVTIHLLDTGIDSGSILAIGRPEIAEDDDEDSLFAKAVQVGARLYVDCIRAMVSGKALPRPQALAAGREYRFVDRTVGAERRVERLLNDGLLRRYAKQLSRSNGPAS